MLTALDYCVEKLFTENLLVEIVVNPIMLGMLSAVLQNDLLRRLSARGAVEKAKCLIV